MVATPTSMQLSSQRHPPGSISDVHHFDVIRARWRYIDRLLIRFYTAVSLFFNFVLVLYFNDKGFYMNLIIAWDTFLLFLSATLRLPCSAMKGRVKID